MRYAARRPRTWAYYKNSLAYASLYMPALILYLLFVIIPLVGAFFYSFTDWNGINPSFNMVGLRNYAELFRDPNVMRTVGTTFKYTITITVMCNLVALLLALALNMKLKTRNIMRSVYFLPSVLSGLIVGYIWSFMFTDPLMQFGKLIGNPVLGRNALSSREWAIFAAAGVTVWRSAGWYMMIYIAGLQGIPSELVEAAAIDGANPWQRTRHITLPLLAPSFTVNIILAFERGLKDFDSIFALTGGGPGDATLTIAINIYRQSFFFSRAGYGTAIGIMLFLLVAGLSLVQLVFLRRGENSVN
ncbi:sugar ABC transporter permease [Eubacteriales bacterium OttesenSCG-928-A19]|nr:sugar ABC transporter permease [Eubacteriales bacterium OttesenSCG-928-A19]